MLFSVHQIQRRVPPAAKNDVRIYIARFQIKLIGKHCSTGGWITKIWGKGSIWKGGSMKNIE